MKIIFLLAVAVLAAADVSDLSEEVAAAASYSSSSPVPFLKSKLTCLTNQLKACERILYKVKGCKEEPRVKVYKDCNDALQKGQRRSGIYTLIPDRQLSFQAYCDMQTDGGGWTVFQRRKDGSVNFYRNWKDYVVGFGDLNGEHWLGLEKIYRQTKQSRSSLRVDLGDYSGNKAYAKYKNCRLGNADSRYTLHISDYSGSAGDALKYHNGMKFTTKDRDNDVHARVNCAVDHKGAWWYRKCDTSNLNGLYSSTRRTGWEYNEWHSWKKRPDSLKFTEMKVRRQ